jgi:hypothetical protein
MDTATEGARMAAEPPTLTPPATSLSPRTGILAVWNTFHRSASVLRRLAAYRVIVYVVIGLLALDGLLHANRDLWNKYDPDDYAERLEGCRRRPRDLVLIGGSPVSEGIDPATLAGLSWRGAKLNDNYNLGLPGATTSEVWHAVEHGLPAPPRLLVYGITASDLNDSRYEPHGTRSLMDLGDVAEWVRTRPDSAEWAVRHFIEERVGGVWQLFFYRNALRLWAADQTADLCPDAFPKAAAQARANLEISADLRNGNGFVPERSLRKSRLDRLRMAGALGPRFHFLENYRLGGHLLYLHKLLDWAEANGVAVVLVDMPVPAELEEQMHVAAFAAYRKTLAEVAQQRGVPLLCASRKATGIEESDFADRIHLNTAGTSKLSAWLRQALAALPE